MRIYSGTYLFIRKLHSASHIWYPSSRLLHSVSQTEPPIERIEAAASVEHLENPLHGTDCAIIAEIDETMSSNSRRSCTDEWITAANTSVLAEKQIFFTKKQLYSKLHVLALQEKFQFRVSRSSLKMLTVVCVDDNCKWMIRASIVKQSAIFMIRKFVAVHTCSLDFRRNVHRHATSPVIAEHILGKLDTPYRSYPPTHIARDMELEFAFGASIRGYMQYLRPVICVDDSHLKGPYKGTLLVATAQDSNKQIYPLARGIVDAETNKSWKWKKSIQKAISQLFPSSQHGYCIWHMEKNLIQRYNNASLLFLFKRAATTFRVEDFERLMEQIRRVSERAHWYLERAGYSFWSRALFIGHRYNIMTNNNAESLNTMLREARSLPITCLVEHIRSTMQKWFYERRANAEKCSTLLTPRMENELRTTFENGTRLRAHVLTNNLTQVGISNNTDIVNLSEETCTCREFQLNRMPCIHASHAACFRGKMLYELCSHYYSSDYWKGAHSETIYPVPREVDWVVPSLITCTPIFPPLVRRPPGRPPTHRKRSRYEYAWSTRKCTRCGRVGHNRTTCSNPPCITCSLKICRLIDVVC
ncbi:uncharacterized protein LOC111397883 [Olea europaea var. sylvestris]|uniref:uncharacterized protein LOC111397883 n=1 Tax=Olea europaea var. sylvestris TaxID=158386 RepID=UPI000C1D2020|nr:uncharacterized protein LOC111397883 [Olea europaea var. sylvestris]